MEYAHAYISYYYFRAQLKVNPIYDQGLIGFRIEIYIT